MTSSMVRRATHLTCVAVLSLATACGDKTGGQAGAQPTSAPGVGSSTEQQGATTTAPAAAAASSGESGPCAAGTSTETNRAMTAYSKVIAAFMNHVHHHDPIRAIYLVDRFTPGEDPAEESPAAPDPADTAPFPADMRHCFESLQLDGLPAMTLVKDYDDPGIRRDAAVPGGKDPAGPVAEGVVLELSRIPGTERIADIAISAYFGFNDMEGATYRANESDQGWNIMMRGQWIT